MSKQVPIIGVTTVTLSAPDPTASALPSLNSLTFTVSAITPNAGTRVNNEGTRDDLTVGANYQVCIAPFGYDITNGGFAIGKSSAGSGIVTVTVGQVIGVHVANASWPAGMFTAGDHRLVAVFLKKNSGSFQLCDFAYVPSDTDFDFAIQAEPNNATPVRSLAFLQNASTDTLFKVRDVYPGAETDVGVTSGGVTEDRTVSQASVSPDNSPDYQIVTSRGINVTFSTLNNGVVDIVRGTAGLACTFTAPDGDTVTLAQQTMLTASAILKGNAFIILNEPDNSIRILAGNLTVSQTQVTFSRTKTAPALLNYNLQTAAVDGLTLNMDSEVVYLRE